MNRYFLFVSLLAMSVLTVCAQPVSRKAAQQTAQEFFQQQLNSKGLNRAPRMVGVEDVLDGQYNGYLYLFNASDGQGFVIVSGDERTTPILGYSTSGTIDTRRMPDNMRSWLQHYADQIALMQQHQLPANTETPADCGEPIAPQLRSNWIQNPLFNESCPMVTVYSDPECTQRYEYADMYGNKTTESGRSVTGCSSTALAQVLNHNKYPMVVTADIPGRSDYVYKSADESSGAPVWLKYSDSTIPAGTVIDWDNILDQYYFFDEEKGGYVSPANADQKKAVADLSHICGASMDVVYGLAFHGGSQAKTDAAVKAAVKYFGLKNASGCVSSNYNYQEWLQALYDELKVAGAVYFAGISPGAGHAFVIDGYDKEDLFHVNWGWMALDGFFRINDLNPMGTGGYVFNQVFARGLYPGAPSVAPEMQALECTTPSTSLTAVNGLFTLPKLTVRVKNVRLPYMNVEVGLTIERQGVKTTLPTDGISHEVEFMNKTNVELTDFALGQLADGEYLCYPAFRLSGSEEWIRCSQYDQAALKLTVEGVDMTIENIIRYQLAVKAENKSVYKVGEPIDFKVTVELLQGSLYDRHALVYCTIDEQGNRGDTEPIGAIQELYAEEGDMLEMNYSLPEGLPAGTYSCGLVLLTYENYYPFCTITVEEDATGIRTVRQTMADDAAYNLNGQRITDGYRGIVVRNGKKELVR